MKILMKHSCLTAALLAQSGECRYAEREVAFYWNHGHSVCVYILRGFKSFAICRCVVICNCRRIRVKIKVVNCLALHHLAFQMCRFHLSDYFFFSVPPVSYFLGFIIDCLHNTRTVWERPARCVMRGKGREENKLFLLGKKRLLHRLIISYKLDETSFFISECFIRTHRTWITANASIYKISTWVDIFHFQFSTSISPYYQHPLEQKSASYLPELPPIQPEVNREKQLVATWFTLVAPKTENLYLGMKKWMLGLSVKPLTGFMPSY